MFTKRCGPLSLETLLRLNQERKELPSSEYESLDALNWQIIEWNLHEALHKNFVFRAAV